MQYQEVLRKVYGGDFSTIPDRLLCLDPGHTTGWALFENGILTAQGETVTVETKGTELQISWNNLVALFEQTNPTQIICEDYRVYAHKLERHSFSKVETLRLIGGIDFISTWLKPAPIAYAMAVQAKGFVTDTKLKDYGMYAEGLKHSRDAIRHGVYYLIITNAKRVQ